MRSRTGTSNDLSQHKSSSLPPQHLVRRHAWDAEPDTCVRNFDLPHRLRRHRAIRIPPRPPRSGIAQQAIRARRGRRVERFDRVRELHRQGHSVRQIAAEARLSPTTVRRYLQLRACPEWAPGRVEPSRLDAHRDWIDGRIAAGCRNASTNCRAQAKACYAQAPPTGSANCRIWEAKCQAIADGCDAGAVRGPPDAGKVLTPPPRSVNVPPPTNGQSAVTWALYRVLRVVLCSARCRACRAGLFSGVT